MWDLSFQPGIEPASPALEGEPLTTGPPEKPPLFEADLCGLHPEVLLLSGLQLDLANGKHTQKVREQEKREGVLFIFPTHGLAVSLG